MITGENFPGLVHLMRQTKIPPRPERFVAVVTDARVLVRIEPLLNCDSTQA